MKNSPVFRKSLLAVLAITFAYCPQAHGQQAYYANGQVAPPPTFINSTQGWPPVYTAMPPQAYPQVSPYQPMPQQASAYQNQSYQGTPNYQAEIEKEEITPKQSEPSLSPYEQQELALKHSREEYGTPEKMPSPNYNHVDLESQLNQAEHVSKTSKIKSVMRNAGRLIGATAAVAIPVTSIVLMSRQAARSGNGSYGQSMTPYGSAYGQNLQPYGGYGPQGMIPYNGGMSNGYPGY
jgi:hypothetical protein